LFDQWGTDADHGFTGRQNNKNVLPLELLLLGSLRYVGRGWTFDDIEEATKVSCDVHLDFLRFHDIWCEIFVPSVRANASEYDRLAKL
jgi:hypothetical protein